jgi:murein L,D-transpeptidase YcbB/YkuD
MPHVEDPKVQTRVELTPAVPVFVTYLTVSAGPGGVTFRNDPYGRDTAVLARFFGAERLLQ